MKFEYKQVEIGQAVFKRVKKREEVEQTLNELGREGWELVNFVSCVTSGYYIYIFKRPLRSEF
jgi:hypothetical protein